MKTEYLVLNSDGSFFDVQDNEHDAIQAAKGGAYRDGGGVYADPYQLIPQKTQNPAPFVDKAYQGSGLNDRSRELGYPIVGESSRGEAHYGVTKEFVMAMSLGDAYERLKDYLPAAPPSGRTRPEVWSDVTSAAQGLMKPNTKMNKEASELFLKAVGRKVKASSYGLSLLPHFVPARAAVRPTRNGGVLSKPPFGFKGARAEAAMAKHYSPERDGAEFTWCYGSSEACRSTCLVYSGQNQVADEAIWYKHALSAALMHDPAAFARFLVESVRRQTMYKGKAGERWTRLNVYQDIPWELFFPDFFYRAGEGSEKDHKKVGGWVPNLRCYDYTKTAGRDFTPGYNLTFSYNGANQRLCAEELARGRNIAVVLVLQGKKGPVTTVGRSWEKKPLRKRYPEEFLYPIDLGDTFGKNVPVLNGDTHDIRPYDRLVLDKIGWQGGAVVGLDFKRPMIKTEKGKSVPLFTVDDAGKFVMRVQETNSGALLYGGGVAGYMLTEIP